MARITMEEQQEFAVLPVDSILELKVEHATVKTVDGRNGTWQKVEFEFKVLGVQALGDGGPVEQFDDLITRSIYGSVPFKLTDSPENKLRQWAEAILGMELGIGFELDTDMFEGRQCRGITSQYKTKAGYDRHQVESLLPKGGSAAASAPVASSAGSDPWATPAPAGAGSTQDPWGSTSWGADDEPPF